MQMLNVDEKVILDDFRKAIRLSEKDSVIDVDQRVGKKLDSFLLRLESSLNEIGPNIPAYRAATFVIMYVSKGDGKQIVGKTTFTVKDRTLVIIPPRAIRSYSSYSELSKGYYLSFNLKYYFQLHFPVHHLLKMHLFKKNLIPFCYLDMKTGQDIERIFELIFEEGHQQRRNKNELIALKILELIILCDRQVQPADSKAGDYYSPLLIQYIDLINDHYKEHHTTGYYAGKLNIHPNSLNATAKRYLDQSAKEILDTKLISEAKYLLFNTSLSAKEIAYEIGFNSPSHFFRFFKRYTGNSPLHYRQKHLNL